MFSDRMVVVRGGGDLGTGVVARLHRVGFPVVVLELAVPLSIRRPVCVSTAVTEGSAQVEDLVAVAVGSWEEAVEHAHTGGIPVLVPVALPTHPISVVVDARLAKRNIDTRVGDAEFVVGLGPGFVVGEHCHAVVETQRGHHLGRVFWRGSAAADTGVPGVVGGESAGRVLRAARSGSLSWTVAIGDVVSAGDALGRIDGTMLQAPIGGVVRGLLAGGFVSPGLKIADIDPRADPAACFEISDKSLAVGGGVLEAVLTWLSRSG